MTSFMVAMTLDAFDAQDVGETLSVSFDTQLENAPARSLQRADGALRGNRALVENDHIFAGQLNIGKQVRGEDQRDLFVGGDIAHEREHLVAPLWDPCRWSARPETIGRDRAQEPAPA